MGLERGHRLGRLGRNVPERRGRSLAGRTDAARVLTAGGCIGRGGRFRRHRGRRHGLRRLGRGGRRCGRLGRRGAGGDGRCGGLLRGHGRVGTVPCRSAGKPRCLVRELAQIGHRGRRAHLAPHALIHRIARNLQEALVGHRLFTHDVVECIDVHALDGGEAAFATVVAVQGLDHRVTRSARLIGRQHHPPPRDLRAAIRVQDAAAVDLDAAIAVAQHQLPVGRQGGAGTLDKQHCSKERAEASHRSWSKRVGHDAHRLVLPNLERRIVRTLPHPVRLQYRPGSRWGCPPRTG